MLSGIPSFQRDGIHTPIELFKKCHHEQMYYKLAYPVSGFVVSHFPSAFNKLLFSGTAGWGRNGFHPLKNGWNPSSTKRQLLQTIKQRPES